MIPPQSDLGLECTMPQHDLEIVKSGMKSAKRKGKHKK
jgi:hypothetical protein